jgi:hypothetical protein
MKRRHFVSGLGAAAAVSSLSAPSLAQPARARTLVFAPVGGLLVLDPSFTTVSPTTNHGYYVFDTLYSIDSKYRAMLQMAAGHTVSDDNLTWNIKLRPGLKFHDGTPVLARDCVASIRRWAVRDSFGASLMNYTDELSAPNDATIRFRLKRPFGILPDALAHPVALPCFIMPERIAAADINKAITEMVGSGPFRFVAGEFVANLRAVYEKKPGLPAARGGAGRHGGRQDRAFRPGRMADHPRFRDDGGGAAIRRDRLVGERAVRSHSGVEAAQGCDGRDVGCQLRQFHPLQLRQRAVQQSGAAPGGRRGDRPDAVQPGAAGVRCRLRARLASRCTPAACPASRNWARD